MAGEHSETQALESTAGGDLSADRAAFIAGDLGEAVADDAAPSVDADEDTDTDLDADADLDEVETASEEATDDEDSDLDEDEPDDKDADPETTKRLTAVRRTDKRLRERREQDFAKREAELVAREQQIHEQFKPHIESLDKFERAKARVGVDPAGVLLSLGLSEDRFEHAAQVLYTLAKAKDDPKARTAAAQLLKDRERDEEIERLKSRDKEREERDRQREQQAAADRELDAYFGKVVKATSDKTPLAAAFLKTNPTAAREQMQLVAFRLAKETGALPKERDVVVALEKDRRRILRDLGIDPKTVSAAKATAAIAASTDTKAPAAKKPKAKPVVTNDNIDDDEKPVSKADFIKLNGRYS